MDVVKNIICAFCIGPSVTWTITSNYPINYYTSMFNEIHATVAYPGGFSGCLETPPPGHDFF